MMLLSETEKKRFCEYLLQQINSSKAIQGPMAGDILKREKIKCAAYQIVLIDIESFESQVINDNTSHSTD